MVPIGELESSGSADDEFLVRLRRKIKHQDCTGWLEIGADD